MAKRQFENGWYSTAISCDFVAIEKGGMICAICVGDSLGFRDEIGKTHLDFYPKGEELDSAITRHPGLNRCRFDFSRGDPLPREVGGLIYAFGPTKHEWDDLFELR